MSPDYMKKSGRGYEGFPFCNPSVKSGGYREKVTQGIFFLYFGERYVMLGVF
jgi:hypothetical protein